MSAKRVSVTRFQASMCRDSFYQFFLEFWRLTAAEDLVESWYIRKLCDELQVLSERVFANKPKEHDLVWNCPPGTSKPVWEETAVLMGDGSWKALKNVKVGDTVIGKGGGPCRVSAVHVQGMLPCVVLATAAGRRLVVAPDHPVLTADGWVEAGRVVPGMVVALMHKALTVPTCHRSDDEFALAGYLIGDGSLTQNQCNLTSADPDYTQDFCALVRRLDYAYSVKTKRSKGCTDICRISLRRKLDSDGRWMKGPRDWVREVGLYEKNSYTKCVPGFVWRGTDRQVAVFLAAYFHCDGHVSCRDGGKRNLVVSMTTVSRKLAVGLQRLFLRLGVSMRLRKHVSKNGFKYNRGLKGYVTYRVETSDQDAAVRFMERVPLKGRKKAKLGDFLPQRRTFEQQYWPDRVLEVTTVGPRPCRCLTVEGDESFVAEGIVVHNSSVVSILWQPWIWTRMPSARFISGSYSERLALDLSRKSRDVITSDKYKALFPEVTLREDQNTKGYFANSHGGMRYATGVGGSVVGMHAHFIAVDDPIDPLGSLSDLIVAEANSWMTETLSRRKVNVMLTPTVLIMQRLHQDDPTGNRLSQSSPVRHCCLPGDDSWEVKPEQWRELYVDGCLDPARVPREALREALDMLGEAGYACQYGQSPVARGGALFKVDRLTYRTVPPPGWRAGPVRYWDKAATSKGGAFTVGTRMALGHDGKVWVLDVVRDQWDSAARERAILDTANRDGKKTRIAFEQEPAGAGKESAESAIRAFTAKGFRIVADRVTGDKELRADLFSQYVNNGDVVLVEGAWNRAFVEELRFFPRSKYKDQVDSASGAFNQLVKRRLRIGSVRR